MLTLWLIVLIALWIVTAAIWLGVAVHFALSRIRHHNRQHSASDEHAHGYGIGGGFIEHHAPQHSGTEANDHA